MKLDKDNSGTIERDEFLSLPQVSSNPLATRMIAIFDEDGGGDVDFQEFVSGLSAFSSKGNKEEKLRFAFKVYDIDRDGFISNGELFIVLKMMVGSNLKDQQLQQIVDKTIMEADLDRDGKISFEEFQKMVENCDVSMSMTLGMLPLSLFLFMVWMRDVDVVGGADGKQINSKARRDDDGGNGIDTHGILWRLALHSSCCYVERLYRRIMYLRLRNTALLELNTSLPLPALDHLRMVCSWSSNLISFRQLFHNQPRQR